MCHRNGIALVESRCNESMALCLSSRVDCGGDGFNGDVVLDVISIAVESETMTANDVTKGQFSEDVGLDVVCIAAERP